MMNTSTKEEIRQAVREHYTEIANRDAGPTDLSPATSCCGNAGQLVQTLSTAMGYSEEEINSVPEGANMGLGCGNPLGIATLRPGETVIDLGSGGGFDCFLAANKVGETGRVIGVDMTPDMISKARKNAEKIGTHNVEFRLGEIEHLPVPDESADLIMSNCVINLSADKPQVYQEVFRVLKPGGRLAITDIVATAPLPEDVQQDLTLVSACVGGASLLEETKQMLEEKGFENISITPREELRDLVRQGKPDLKALDYIVSANIEAKKPDAG